MSDYRVISAVTTMIKRILESEIETELGTHLAITTQAPHTIKAEPQENGINIFLYLVTNNSGYSNYDLPRRDTDGGIISKPLVGLDLHYLLTPFSVDNEEILTQQILASTVRILHEKSALTQLTIKDEIGLIPTSEENLKEILEALAEQKETVNLVWKPLSVEELTKLWSSYFQTNYRLSLAYLASPVIIESIKEPIHPLPVQERKIFVQQFRSPVIDRIEPAVIQWDSNATKRSINIMGKNLTSQNMTVEIMEEPSATTIPPTTTIPLKLLTVINNESIIVKLPDDISAGVKKLRIVQGISDGNGDMGLDLDHKAHKSNISTFTLAPLLITDFPLQVVQGKRFKLEFKPPVQEKQKVEILIGEHTFSPFEKNQTFPTERIKIDKNDFPVGKFLFRLRVDGAESFLLSGQNKAYIGPEIEVKAP